MTITLTPAPQSWDGTTVDARAFGGVLIVCTSAPGSAWTIKGSPDNNSDFFTQVASVNNGSSISSEVTIINAIGMYYLGGNQFVELTGGSGGGLFISGLPSANASGAQTPNAFWNEATGAASALTGSGTFTGTARDVGVAAGLGHGRSYFGATFAADQGGTANIQCSNDNSTWRTIATNALTAGSPLIMSVPVTTRYYRAQVVNGSSAQTYLWVDDSFTGA